MARSGATIEQLLPLRPMSPLPAAGSGATRRAVCFAKLLELTHVRRWRYMILRLASGLGGAQQQQIGWDFRKRCSLFVMACICIPLRNWSNASNRITLVCRGVTRLKVVSCQPTIRQMGCRQVTLIHMLQLTQNLNSSTHTIFSLVRRGLIGSHVRYGIMFDWVFLLGHVCRFFLLIFFL